MSQYLPSVLRKRTFAQENETHEDDDINKTNNTATYPSDPPPAKKTRLLSQQPKGFFETNITNMNFNTNTNNSNDSNNNNNNSNNSNDNSVNRIANYDKIDRELNLSSMSQDQQLVAAHYNEIMQYSHEEREQSKIIQSRKLHNWIKSVLISLFIKEDSIVLDIGGGKGGDLFKYKQQNISELVLVDHAINSLKDGMLRYNDAIDKGSIRYPLHLICCDAFGKNLDLVLNSNNNNNVDSSNSDSNSLKNILFDIVSSQFVIHYAFESKSRVLALLHNITKRLRSDGYFIGTTPDSNVLIKKWRNTLDVTNHSFGNDNYNVRMDYNSINSINNSVNNSNNNNVNKNNKKKSGKELKNFDDPFGIRYFFRLSDAVNDCPEYLLHFPTFVKMASQEPFNLELVLEMNFHEFFVRFCNGSKYYPLLRRLKVYDPDSHLSSIGNSMWDIAYLYKVFAFKKKKSPNDKSAEQDAKFKQRKPPNVKRLNENDIRIVE